MCVCMYMNMCVYICKGIYYKNLSHVIMEAGQPEPVELMPQFKSPDWQTGRADVPVQRPSDRRILCYSGWGVNLLFCSGLQLTG